jgi:ribosomal protein S18 acetylase RimI-like enzyme
VSFEVREARLDDAAALLAVWIARDIADTGAPDYTLDDVEGDFSNPEVETFVAEADGRLLGAAIIDDRGGQVATHPDHEGLGVGTALRETIEARCRARGNAEIRVYIVASNTGAQKHLADAGYAVAFHFVKLESGREDLPAAAPPVPGIRPFRLGEEDQAAHEVVLAAFSQIPGDVPTSYEAFRAEMLDRAGFMRESSFAVDDDAGLCGVVLCQEREEHGYVGDLAVLPRAQGRGLGRGLLLTALASFRAAGKEGGYLWVNGSNAPALGLYESAGMRESLRSERWEKTL